MRFKCPRCHRIYELSPPVLVGHRCEMEACTYAVLEAIKEPPQLTGRQLAEKLLALPNPDLPVEVPTAGDENYGWSPAELVVVETSENRPEEDWEPHPDYPDRPDCVRLKATAPERLCIQIQ